jgi:hypothetical protein
LYISRTEETAIVASALVTNARYRLSSVKNYKLLDELLLDIHAANIEEWSVTQEVLAEYRRGRQRRCCHEGGIKDTCSLPVESEPDVEFEPDAEDGIASTAAVEGNFTGCRLNDFKDSSNLVIMKMKLSPALVKIFVREILFAKCAELCDMVVAEAATKLAAVQAYLNFLHKKQLNRQEQSVLQPIVVLFLNWLVGKICGTVAPLTVSGAQTQPSLVVRLKDRESKYNVFTGQTDLIVSHGPVDLSHTVINVNSIFELKTPFGSLYHRNSEAEKHQMLLEIMGIRAKQDVKDCCGLVKGCLTDLFTVIPVVQLSDSDIMLMYHSTSQREQVIYYILLILCDSSHLTEEVLAGLCRSEQAAGSKRKADDSQGDETSSRKWGGGDSYDNKVSQTGNGKLGDSKGKTGQNSKRTRTKTHRTICWNDAANKDDVQFFEEWYNDLVGALPLTAKNLETYAL